MPYSLLKRNSITIARNEVGKGLISILKRNFKGITNNEILNNNEIKLEIEHIEVVKDQVFPIRSHATGLYEGDGRECPTCHKKYKSKSSFCRHPCRRKIANNGNTFFTCSSCHSAFSSKRTLDFHAKKNCSSVEGKQRKCIEPNCDFYFYHISTLYSHLEEHHFGYSVEHKQFPNLDEFNKWKENENKTHFISMYCRSGVKTIGTTQYSYYLCNFNRAPKKKKRRLKHREEKKIYMEKRSDSSFRMPGKDVGESYG